MQGQEDKSEAKTSKICAAIATATTATAAEAVYGSRYSLRQVFNAFLLSIMRPFVC